AQVIIPSPGGGGSLSAGNTLYVDAVNGNDTSGARGMANKPFKTLGAANTAASAGDVIHVRPGSNYVAAPVALKALTVIGEGRASRIVAPGLSLGILALIVTNSNTEISNLRLESTGAGIGYAGAENITASNIVIRDLEIDCGQDAVEWTQA